MPLGLTGRLNVLQESPLDHTPLAARSSSTNELPQLPTSWVASRYNIQTTTEDGRLILWNTFRGKMYIFRPDQRDTVKALLTRRQSIADSNDELHGFLREQGFLIKSDTDEYRQFQHAFGHQHYRQDILELILLASEDCNFRCQYCYEDFTRGTMKPDVRDSIKKLVEKKSKSIRHLSISWFGGEPLYGWQAIEDLAPYFMKVATDNEISFQGVMTTNGYLLTPDIAAKLFSWGVLTYQITIDGLREDHNRNRPGRNGEPTFDVIFQNLVSLKRFDANFLIYIRINFDRQNRAGIQGLIDALGKEFGGDPRFRLLVRPVGRWGGDNDASLDVCGVHEIDEVKDDILSYAMDRSLNNGDDVRFERSLGSNVCYAARPYNFIIGADGLVMKCTVDLDKKDRNIVGRIANDGSLVLDRDKVALWTEPAFASDQKCQKCVVLPLCQGISCPQVRLDHHRSPCIPLRHGAKKALVLADRAKSKKGRLAKPTISPLIVNPAE
jgi:uncharacterized protein